MEQSRVRGGGRGGSLPICSSMSGRPLPLDPQSPGAFPLSVGPRERVWEPSSSCFHSLPRGLPLPQQHPQPQGGPGPAESPPAQMQE